MRCFRQDDEKRQFARNLGLGNAQSFYTRRISLRRKVDTTVFVDMLEDAEYQPPGDG